MDDSPKPVDELLAEIDRLGRKKKPGMRASFYSAAVLCGVPVSIGMIAEGLARGSVEPFIGAAILAGSLGLTRITLSRRHRDATVRLTAVDDVRAVGPLAEALSWPDPHLRRLAAGALTRLLPRLLPADTHLLNNRQRECLYRDLHYGSLERRGALVLAILQALRQIGDTSAIPPVEALARGPVVQFATNARAARELGVVGILVGSTRLRPAQQRIKEAAGECLEILRVRADENRASRVLLRPSAPDSENTLLRPASTGPEPDSSVLLRPAAASADEQHITESAQSPEQEIVALIAQESPDSA